MHIDEVEKITTPGPWEGDKMYWPAGFSEADAAYLAHCANTHKVLREALDWMTALFAKSYEGDPNDLLIFRQANTALAAAQEVKGLD